VQTQSAFDLCHLFWCKQQVEISIDLRAPLGDIGKNNHTLPRPHRRVWQVRASAEVHNRLLVCPLAVQELLDACASALQTAIAIRTKEHRTSAEIRMLLETPASANLATCSPWNIREFPVAKPATEKATLLSQRGLY
jgi:hypothetical protein